MCLERSTARGVKMKAFELIVKEENIWLVNKNYMYMLLKCELQFFLMEFLVGFSKKRHTTCEYCVFGERTVTSKSHQCRQILLLFHIRVIFFSKFIIYLEFCIIKRFFFICKFGFFRFFFIG